MPASARALPACPTAHTQPVSHWHTTPSNIPHPNFNLPILTSHTTHLTPHTSPPTSHPPPLTLYPPVCNHFPASQWLSKRQAGGHGRLQRRGA